MDRHRSHRIDYQRTDAHRPRRTGPGGERGSDDSTAPLILIPVFNDWVALAELLSKLDSVLSDHGIKAEVLVVDDGSTLEPDELRSGAQFTALQRVDVLTLRRNLGHQRAIAIGLAYVEDCLNTGAVVVMDGDGEDDPADVPRLLNRLHEAGGRKIVFAERARRSESIGFKAFYALYKLIHWLLTGKGVRIGNFSAVPRRRLASLVAVSELWNHYAAAVVRSRQPYCMVPTKRGKRYCGQSTMNFVALVTHGLSAISVHADVAGVRLLMLSGVLGLLTLLGIVAAVIVRLATNLAVPGWATYTVGILMVLLVQAMLAAFVFSFVILGARHGSTFLPRRDYAYFIGTVWTVHGPERSASPFLVGEAPREAMISRP
jgi:polyisoprenyl-phosphate glycosyltransferase